MRADIGIDARILQRSYGAGRCGMSRWLAEMLSALQTLDTRRQYVLFVEDPSDVVWQPTAANFGFSHIRRPWPWRSSGTGPRSLYGSPYEHVIFPLRISREGPRVMHFITNRAPLVRPFATVVTLHDVIPLIFARQRLRRLNSRIAYRLDLLGCRRSDVIITDSRCAKCDIVRELHVDPKRVKVIYPGVGAPFGKQDHSVHPGRFIGELSESQPFFLYYGGTAVNKNVEAVIRAFAILMRRRPDTLLLMVVHEEDRRRLGVLATHFGVSDNIVFADHLSDEQLVSVLNHTVALVYPSIYEGFGLPPLEAMACGASVIASDRASLPEVVGEAGILVDPNDTEAIARAMSHLLDAPDLRSHLSDKGVEQAKRFTWKAAAERLAVIYEEALAGARQ